MRIRLNLNYVLKRSCDHGQWTGWCPEVGVWRMGTGLTGALLATRASVRAKVETCLSRVKHPARLLSRELIETDEYSRDYTEFLGLFNGSTLADDDSWTRTYNEKHVPDHIDTAFACVYLMAETFSGQSILSDEWYGELWYRHDGKVNVTALVEMTYEMDRYSAETDPRGYIRLQYGHTVIGDIKSITPRG